jgi:hypothetical protein
MESGRTCQPQRPLNRPHRSLALHTVMRWSLYTVGGHRPTCSLTRHLILYEVNTWTKKSVVSPIALELACAAALLLLLPRPIGSAHDVQPPLSHSHHRQSWGKGSLSSRLPLAPSWSSSRRPSMPDEQVHHAAFFFHMGRR